MLEFSKKFKFSCGMLYFCSSSIVTFLALRTLFSFENGEMCGNEIIAVYEL